MSMVGRGQKTEVEITPGYRKRTKASVGDHQSLLTHNSGAHSGTWQQGLYKDLVEPNMSGLGLHIKTGDSTVVYRENAGWASKASPGVFPALRTKSKASLHVSYLLHELGCRSGLDGGGARHGQNLHDFEWLSEAERKHSINRSLQKRAGCRAEVN